MNYSIFLPDSEDALKSKLSRLIEISLKQNFVPNLKNPPNWRPDFFKVERSIYWEKLSPEQQEFFLETNSRHLLKEAICIEHAGIAYAHKMALTAQNQEERHYYTCVAKEELEHLLWLRSYLSIEPNKSATDFASMISRIIESESRRNALALIQVLLEGWGITYYSQLHDGTDHVEIKNIFLKILNDESRHHAGGIILFQNSNHLIDSDFIQSIQNLINVIRIGPQQVATSLCQIIGVNRIETIEKVLLSLDAISETNVKLLNIRKILSKILTEDDLCKLDLSSFDIRNMANLTNELLQNQETPCVSKGIDL